ncbi:hypothetical protein [Ferrimonas marina]|uniref:hypothetical protein n=1 Tax=Ferrimonas marina TaxID=299255 RepID=UPI00146FEEC7|nr:hypothetical protein [Ferrimonas marina]
MNESRPFKLNTRRRLLNAIAMLMLIPCLTMAAPLLPQDDKILLFVGQDSDTIAKYAEAMPEDPLEGVTLYAFLKHEHPEQSFPTLLNAIDFGSGTVNFGQTLSAHPNAALAVGLAFDRCNDVDHAQRILDGSYDTSVGFLVSYLKDLAPRPVFLRIGYEFDGLWNCYEPDSYTAVFRLLHQRLEQAGADNVVTVWQSAAWPDPTEGDQVLTQYDHRRAEHLSQWYPGDDVVDWVSLSVFYRDLSQWDFVPPDHPAAIQEKILAFARERDKPVMIAEAAPQAYRTGAQTRSYIHFNQQRPFSGQQIWDAWYQPFFDFIYANQDVIRAVAYINTHWETQPMWRCDEGLRVGDQHCQQGNWGDSRVQANPEIRQRWLEQIHNPAIWVQHEQLDRQGKQD